MKKALLILAVLLIGVYCYAEDDSAAGTDKNPEYTAEKLVVDSADTYPEDKAIADKEIHDTPVEYADMYEDGTGEREKLLPDYGGGDLGQVDLDD